jgi:hypothetical protein
LKVSYLVHGCFELGLEVILFFFEIVHVVKEIGLHVDLERQLVLLFLQAFKTRLTGLASFGIILELFCFDPQILKGSL